MEASSDRFKMIPGMGAGKDTQGLLVFYPMVGEKSAIFGAERRSGCLLQWNQEDRLLSAIPESYAV